MSLLSLVAFVAVGCGAAPDDDAAPADMSGDEVAVEEGEGTVEEADPNAEAPVDEEMSGTDVFAFEPAEPGGTLVIGQNQEPDTLYTYGGSMLAGSFVLSSIYDGPIEGLDYDYQAVIFDELPKLENGGAVMNMVSVDAGAQYVDAETQEVVTATETVTDLPQLVVTFVMKDGLTWQDGTPVTGEDSVFSRGLACHPDTPTSKYTCERTTSYEATDDHTLVWTGLPGFTDQTYFTNFYTPLPRHQPSSDGTTTLADMEPTAILEDEEFTRKPWSYGPFKIDEWESGEKIVLSKNEYYWRASEGLPFLDSVIYRIIPDSNALLAAIKSGDIDVATQSGMGLDQYDALTEAEAAGELTPHYVVGTVWEHIDFNLNPIDDRVAVGACVEVRQAVAHGTDRQNMVDVIQKGKTLVQNTYVPAEHWAYPPDDMLTVYDYDIARANEILDGIGFVDGDGDGVREATEDITCTVTTDVDGNTKDQVIPAGTPLEFTLNTTEGNQMREEATLLFQQNMVDIGVKVNLEYLAANIFFEDGPDGPLFGRRYDLGQFAWLTGVQPPVGLYWCTETPSEENSWAGQNETGWCSPEYDKISKQADNTLERAKALPMYHQAQQIFSENLPVLPLFARVKVMATTPDVVNFMPNPTVNAETWNIETWGFAAAGE
jgi:peptide/nickel transport system substrate-binding protein